VRVAAAIVAAAALFVAAGASAGPGGKPSLGVLTMHPLTLQGSNFDARERVLVQAIGEAGASRRIVATRAGTFVVRFDSVSTSRCELIRAIAIGAGGSRATLKYLPAPACRMDLRPVRGPGADAG
jgi:hypothetical protein